MHSSTSSTDISLLSRLRRSSCDETAWREFVERYGKQIFLWCENRGLQANDAEDVTQQVLIRISKYLRTFQYDSSLSFRGYLRRATENSIKDFQKQNNRREYAQGGSELMDWMKTVEARVDLLERLRGVFDIEVLEEAMARVRERVNDARWHAWYLTSIKQRNSSDVACELGMSIAVLYSAKNTIGKLVRDEVQLLEHADPDGNRRA